MKFQLGVICDPVLNGWYRDNRIKNGFHDKNIKSVLEKFDLGKLSEDDILNYFLKYEGVKSTKDELRKEIDSYLSIDIELVEIIKKLKDRGYKTALLSNSNASFFNRKIYPAYPEFKNLFDEIIISSEISMVKPNKDIFEYTLKKINSEPEESLFIDDGKINIDIAVILGIHGFLYADVNSFADYIKSVGIGSFLS